MNLLQASKYASESNSVNYYFCLFASIADGDLAVWAARVALVARLLYVVVYFHICDSHVCMLAVSDIIVLV